MLGDLVGTAFRPCEDKRPGHSRIAEKLDEKDRACGLFNEHDLVVDAVGGFRHRGHGHLDRMNEKVARERGDFVWHRRREKQVLPTFWKGADDPANCLDETEIEHPIGFVEDEEFGVAEARRAGVEVILEAAWGCDQNVKAARERLDLRAMRHAAEDDGDQRRKARGKAPGSSRRSGSPIRASGSKPARGSHCAERRVCALQDNAGLAGRRPLSCRCRSGLCR